MDNAEQPPGFHCEHLDSGACGYLAVINIAGDQATFFDESPKYSVKDACRFNMSELDSRLTTLLANHKAALILDSTHSGTAPGTVSIMDLGALVKKNSLRPSWSSHCEGLFEELRKLETEKTMPKRIVLFAVETDDDPLTTTRIKNLSQLICKAAEALKRECKT